MKDIRPALRAFLLGDATIAGLVAARVYPLKIPQGVKLASVVYTRISGQGDYSMDGPSGYVRTRMQLAAWAPSGDVAISLAEAVKARVDGFSGVWGAGGDAVAIQGVFLADEREMYDDVAQLHGVMKDYLIHYEEL